MQTRDLIELIADGELHSGADLARVLRCSRTAVWKQLGGLRDAGLEIAAVPGRGYRLARPLELLAAGEIGAALVDAAPALESLEVLAMTTSTNDTLRARAAPVPGHLAVLVAEYQSGGRGRHGRRWLSPFGSGLCLSVAWTFPALPPGLSALSLAAGVAVCRALAPWRPARLGLKWPNDIVAGDAKLGGLLIDVAGESHGPVAVIVGIGLNIEAVPDLQAGVDSTAHLPPVGLRTVARAADVSRNAVAAAVIEQLHRVLVEFQDHGFARLANEWRARDVMHGRSVTVRTGTGERCGVAAGIDADGALLVDDGNGIRPVIAGEVSVRPADQTG